MSHRGNEENFGFLAADDNLYAPMQEAFYKQLIDAEARLQLEQQELNAKYKKIQLDKEQTGVRLYNAQQQLAANQMDYEKAHDNFNIAQRLRIQAQQKLSQVNEVYNGKKEQLSILRGKVSKAQKELENLMKHYHQIESYNVQLKSDIAVTKIETFTAEENVANLEKIKKKQDQLIDSMNQESKRLEEQKNILAAQIISQREETEEAKKILRDAQSEMEKVITSKKNLLDRWQKSIAMMQKRDSTVQTLSQRLSNENQINILLINEINGIKTEIRKQQQLTEKLTEQSARVQKEKRTLEIQRANLEQLQSKIASEYQMLKESLQTTTDQIGRSQTERKKVQSSMNLIETNIMKLHTETKRLLEELINQKSQHTTIEKTAYNLVKQAHELQYEVAQKQIQLQNLTNETARVKIDQLNTKSQIELLQSKKKQAQNQQNQKKYLVITYEVQIKQGHDINEKKQHEVGKLNKQHDQLMGKANDQGKNPLENKLINLIRQTQQLEKSCNQFYREWIKKQTVLVHENNKLQQLRQTVTDLENKKMIMEQKKARLNTNYNGFQREIADIKTNLKGLQQQMNKLNDNLAVNSDKKHNLQNQNVNLESEFVEKLKEMEREAIKLEVNIDRIRQEKSELMNEIVECERQILLWERKYQLQRQMQEALDPNVGQSEIQQLKKQLHRMELKYSSLVKQQQKIGAEMLRTVNNKDTIMLKYQATIKREANMVKKQPQTSNQLNKAIALAKQNENKIMKSLQEAERKLAQKGEELENLSKALEEKTVQYRELQSQNHHLQTETVMSKIRKITDVLQIATLQKKYRKFDQISNNRAKLMYREEELRIRLTEMKQKNNQLYMVLDQLSEKYPQYAGLLGPVLETNNIS